MRPNQTITIFIATIALLSCAQFSPTLAQSDNKTEKETANSTIESQFISNARQLTFDGRRAGEGYFSADGSAMVFQSERVSGNPFFQIFVLDFETGDIEPVSPGHGKTTCAWIHPDNQNVLFSSTHGDADAKKKQREEIEMRESGKERRYSWDYDETYELYSFNRETKQYTQLTDAVGYDAEGSYSPDGKLIAFASNRNAYSRELSEKEKKDFETDPAVMMDIFIMNADGTEVKQLTDVPGYDGGPFFSPDGKRICWRRFAENGATAEIFTMNIDGSDEKQLTKMNAMSWAPFYHPSGEYLIYTTNKHGFGNFELYLVDKDGRSPPVRVTETDGFDGLASFTPDGSKLTWTTNRIANDLGSRVGSQIFLGDWSHAHAMEMITASKNRSSKAIEQTNDSNRISNLETSAGFEARDIMKHVDYLCRIELGGRMTGSPGERKATAYVAAYMDNLGLKPAGDKGSWFQEFGFPNGTKLGASNELTFRQTGPARKIVDGYEVEKDWRPLSFSGNNKTEHMPVAFAGYGIVAPAKDGFKGYDSYEGLDVKDKWVLVFRFVPEDFSPEQRQHIQFYASLRKKAFYARQNGAKGLIVVSGPTSQVRSQLVPMQNDFSPNGSSIAAISVSDDVAKSWLSAMGKDLGAIQKSLDDGSKTNGFTIKGLEVAAHVDVKKITGTGRNVIGRLMAGDKPSESAILIGAHIDHLGSGTGNSLAKENERGAIHRGADDNASGVAAMLEVAEYLSDLKRKGKLKLKRDVIFAGWSGEELGLHGSKFYVDSISANNGSPSSDSATKKDGVTDAKQAVKTLDDIFGDLDRDQSLFRSKQSRLKESLDEFRRKRLECDVRLEQLRESKKEKRIQLEQIVEKLTKIKQLVEATSESGSLQKNGRTYTSEDIVKTAVELKDKFLKVEQESSRLQELISELTTQNEINKTREDRARRLLNQTSDSIELLDNRKLEFKVLNSVASDADEIRRKIIERDRKDEAKIQSLLDEINEMVERDSNQNNGAILDEELRAEQTKKPKQDPAQGDASFHDFIIVVDAKGNITLNGKPSSVQELKPDVGFIGKSAPDFEIIIKCVEGSDASAVVELCRNSGVKKIKVEMIDAADAPKTKSSRMTQIAACLNMDMVGRLSDKLVLQGIGSSPYWPSAIESKNAIIGLPVTLSDDTQLPTDASSFYQAGVPILSAFTGSHVDYHTPRDTPEKLNYVDAARIAKLMGLITRSLATVEADGLPKYVKVAPKLKQAARSGGRAYLGTVPSYGDDVVGVKLSDVSKGGPADKAGVRGGDIIVGMSGKEIENIYDYTAIIDALKIGQETTIVVKRNGERLELKITPGSRQ